MILRRDESEKFMVHTVTEPEDKMYRVSFSRESGLLTIHPSLSGTYKRGWGCSVRSVMSYDLRFKHTFRYIIAGPSGSRKLSFSLNSCEISNICVPSPDSTVAFCVVTVKRTQSARNISPLESGHSFIRLCPKTLQTCEADRL
jgi:hypothetical protein